MPLADLDEDEEDIKEKDLSIAINMDFKLYTLRFFEFVNKSTNFIEIHDYVHMLMR